MKIKNQTETHNLSDENIELQSNSLSKISMNIPLKSRNSFKTDYCEVSLKISKDYGIIIYMTLT